MTRSNRISLWLVALLAGTTAAEETIEYAEADGTERNSPVIGVTKDEEKEFSGKILLSGRPRRLDIPARRVISLRRGDQDALNQWSKRLATGKRLVATGQLATQGTVPGAEETFEKIAYSVEKGLPGEEEAYAALPWHNMYALYYLIETRYQMGLKGDKGKFTQALANVAEFKERSAKRSGSTIEIDVPTSTDGKASTKKGKVFCWGDSRLLPEVLLYEARILAASGEKEKAVAAFDAVIDRAKKPDGSPVILATATIDKADFEAAGQGSEQQETIFRAAGSVLSSIARNQPDEFGKRIVLKAANRALLRGADLLRESAEQGKLASWDTPLLRYQQLKDGEGARDPVLLVGAQAGLGACLVEKGQGEAGYKALLGVVVSGQADPEQMALCFYYMGRAAKLFGDEVDRQGGKGDFLRSEGDRWWSDLKERYPTSRWAEKAK